MNDMKSLIFVALLCSILWIGYHSVWAATPPVLQPPLMESAPKNGLNLKQLMDDAMPGSKPVGCFFICQLQKSGQVGCMTPPVFCREVLNGPEIPSEERENKDHE